jgi:hypothetical protein
MNQTVSQAHLKYCNIDRINKFIDRILIKFSRQDFDTVLSICKSSFFLVKTDSLKGKHIYTFQNSDGKNVYLVRYFFNNRCFNSFYIKLSQPDDDVQRQVSSLLGSFNNSISLVEFTHDLYPKSRSKVEQEEKCSEMLETFYLFAALKKGFSGYTLFEKHGNTVYLAKKRDGRIKSCVTKGTFGFRFYNKKQKDGNHSLRVEMIANRPLLKKLGIRTIDSLPISADLIDFRDYVEWRTIDPQYQSINSLIDEDQRNKTFRHKVIYINEQRKQSMETSYPITGSPITEEMNIYRSIIKKMQLKHNMDSIFLAREMDLDNSRFYLNPFQRK